MNKDVEADSASPAGQWTRRLHLPLYQLLLQLIVDERQLVQIQARLLSEGKLRRQRRRQYQDNNHKLGALWDDYKGKRHTTSSLLCACRATCSVHDAKNCVDLAILNYAYTFHYLCQNYNINNSKDKNFPYFRVHDSIGRFRNVAKLHIRHIANQVVKNAGGFYWRKFNEALECVSSG